MIAIEETGRSRADGVLRARRRPGFWFMHGSRLWHKLPQYGRLLAGALLTVMLAASIAPAATSRLAPATAGTFSSPNWFPLRGDHLIGCAFNSPGVWCGGTYHPYWAIDIQGVKGEPVYAAG